MASDFQFNLKRLLAAIAALSASLAIFCSPPKGQIVRFLLHVFFGFSLAGLAAGLLASARWQGIALAAEIGACLGGSVAIFVYWLFTGLSHQ